MCPHPYNLCLVCSIPQRFKYFPDDSCLAFNSMSMDCYWCLCSRTRGLYCLTATEFSKATKQPRDRQGQHAKKPHDIWDEGMLPPDRPSSEWTMTHSFFASTGGFAFENADDEAHDLSNGRKRLTLIARGVAFSVSCSHVPDVSKAEFTDKSKANNVAKALVITQASWMLLPVIGRLLASLPVILLEINTIAHT